jgi:hypothetical protein
MEQVLEALLIYQIARANCFSAPKEVIRGDRTTAVPLLVELESAKAAQVDWLQVAETDL